MILSDGDVVFQPRKIQRSGLWGAEVRDWWRLPLKSLVFLAVVVVAVPLGIGVPMLAKAAKDWFLPADDFASWVYRTESVVIPLLAAEGLFGLYLKHFATLNLVYGAFGTIMALLLWVYISGCIFVFGACLCAAQAEERSARAQAIVTHNTESIRP